MLPSHQVKQLFLDATEVAAADRTAFLDAACAGNPELRRRVDALLQVHEKADPLLDQPLHLGEEAAFKQAPDSESLFFLQKSDQPDSLGKLDHYEAREIIGRGGMGIVLRATDEKLQRIVAIKVLEPHLASNGAARQRFVREARAAAAVTDDNVIAIHAVEESGPVPYLVMQYVNGMTLEDKLQQNGPLNLPEILRIGLQIADGLSAAHRHGLVHRDIKPSNILLENGIERVKLTDFGLARAVDDASLTKSGIIAGTPLYMSPEQADGSRVDQRSDLFSLGSVMYAMCSGHPPFRAETTMAVLKRISEQTARPLRELNPEIPDWLAAVIDRLMSKSPDQRIQTAEEVSALLGHLLAEMQAGGTAMVKLPADFRRWQRKQASTLRSWISIVAGILLIAVLIGSWMKFGRPTASPTGSLTAGNVQTARDLGPSSNSRLAQSQPTINGGATSNHALPLDDDHVRQLLSGSVKDTSVVGILSEPPPLDVSLKLYPVTLAFSPDGTWLAVATTPSYHIPASAPGEILLFEALTGKRQRVLQPHATGLTSLQWTPDSRQIISAGLDGKVVFSDVATGKPVREITYDSRSSTCLSLAPNGQQLAVASAKKVQVIDVATGSVLHSLDVTGGEIFDVVFIDNDTLVSNGYEVPNHVWHLHPDRVELQSKRIHQLNSRGIAAGPPGSHTVWTTGYDGACRLWDVNTFEIRLTLQHQWVTPSVALNPDASLVATAEWNGGVKLWDAQTGKLREVITAFGGGAWCARFHPKGRYLAAAGANKAVRVVDLETGLPLWPRTPHQGNVFQIALSPSMESVAVGADDGSVAVWNSQTHQVRDRLRHHGGDVIFLGYRVSGSRLIAVSGESFVTVWDATKSQPTGDTFLAAENTKQRIVSADIDDSAQHVALGRVSDSIEVWNIASKQLERRIEGLDPKVEDVVFSSDGKSLWGIANGRAMRWSLESAVAPRTFDLGSRAVALGRAGTKVVVADGVGVIRGYEATSDSPDFEFQAAETQIASVDADRTSGHLIITSLERNQFSIWDIAQRPPVRLSTSKVDPTSSAEPILTFVPDEATGLTYSGRSSGYAVIRKLNPASQ